MKPLHIVLAVLLSPTLCFAQNWQKKYDDPYLMSKEVFVYGLSATPWSSTFVPPHTEHYHYSARIYGEPGTGGFSWTAPFATLKDNPSPPGYWDYVFFIDYCDVPIGSTYSHYVLYQEYWQMRFFESGGSVGLEKEAMPPPAIETWQLIVNDDVIESMTRFNHDKVNFTNFFRLTLDDPEGGGAG